MLASSSANMISTGMLRIAAMISTPTGSAPGKATRVKKIDQARVEPIGAEMTALKIVASTADAERTSPVLLRTTGGNRVHRPGRLLAQPADAPRRGAAARGAGVVSGRCRPGGPGGGAGSRRPRRRDERARLVGSGAPGAALGRAAALARRDRGRGPVGRAGVPAGGEPRQPP